MMDVIETSAPGKLVLLGEYSVLFGAPAIVAAVDRRAIVRLEGSAGDAWKVSAPGLAPGPAEPVRLLVDGQRHEIGIPFLELEAA